MRSELWILILIIVLISFACLFAFLSARTQAFDQKVLVDVAQIAQALKIYHDENNFYPSGSGRPAGINGYLSFWPAPENKCGLASYAYSQKSSGDDYNLSFCLNTNIQGLISGIHRLSAKGIN